MAEASVTHTLKVNIPQGAQVAVSSNIVQVTTTSNGEVILDFIFKHPHEGDNATLVSRVVLPIEVGKALSFILLSHFGKPKSE